MLMGVMEDHVKVSQESMCAQTAAFQSEKSTQLRGPPFPVFQRAKKLQTTKFISKMFLFSSQP